MDEMVEDTQGKPGAHLAAVRLQKGYSPEYVAGKLHLRVRIIELLEADNYHSLPEPVFIKGYLRAYAKLLDVAVDPLIETFNNMYKTERAPEKALWQSRRETNKAEHAIRWLTGFFALIVLTAVAMWWYTNKDNERLFPANVSQATSSPSKTETEIRLTDLSKMRSLLSSRNQLESVEKAGD
jgi:cytoskeleton protein RodZ